MTSVASALLPRREHAPAVTVMPKTSEEKMKAAVWHGTKDIRVDDVPKPMLTDPGDVIIKITTAAICGSDLHLYLNQMAGMKSGDIMGHENMGVITEAGPEVTKFKPGDRVVVAFPIACNHCLFCDQQLYSSCDNTNPSKEQELLYGAHTAGIYGYTHLTGGYPGGQAEYLRVPLADNNCIKVPDQMRDENVILISDVLATAWHANELGEVKKGDNVAIWGAGPVGILAAHCAFARGANRVVLLDLEAYRLDFAKQKIPRLETVDCSKTKPYEAFAEMFKDEDGRYIGPDVVCEAVGFHYTGTGFTGMLHAFEMALKLENDPSSILNELIKCVRKGGRISVVGVYSGYCNHLNIGAFMEKGLKMAAGQTPVQKYWHELMEMVRNGTLHPEMVITHTMPLVEASRGYKIFNDKAEGCVKVILKPGVTEIPPSEEDVLEKHPEQ